MQYLHLNENIPRGTFEFPFEFYHVDESHPQYMMPYHWHMEYEIIRILEGSFQITLDEKSFTAVSGDLIFISGSILHSGIPDHCVYECIVFDMNTFIKSGGAIQSYIQRIIEHRAQVYHHFSGNHPDICRCAGDIFDAFQQRSDGFELQVLGGFLMLFSRIFAQKLYYDVPPQSSRDYKKILQLKNVLEYMEANLSENITLLQLSQAAGMSPKYFCRFFQAMTHRTPMDYLNYSRVEHAAMLLATTRSSVTEIAYSCGFNDLSYFIKTFRKYKQVTPGQYTRH